MPSSVAVAVALAGCATIPPKPGFDTVIDLVGARSPGRTIAWDQGTPEDREASERVRELLAGELTLDGAIQIALLNNRALQAVYGQLGIAQADLVQAGLLENPVLAADVRLPTAEGAAVGAGLGLIQQVMAALQIPLKRRLAGAAFEEAQLTAAAAAVDLVMAVKRAFHHLQGAEQMLELRRTVVEATALSADVARRQHEAGNVTDLDLADELALHEQGQVDLARAETAVHDDREELTALLGLWGADTGWRIGSRLPELPASDPSAADVEAHAVAQRLDLAAARLRIQGALLARDLTRGFRFLPRLGLGVEAEREVDDGVWSVGPAVALPIPIFDQGQAALGRHAAEIRRREDEYAALETQIRSQARRAAMRMARARELAERYWNVLLPLRVKVLRQTQLHYNAMQAGVFQLLTAKRDEIDAGRGYIEALRDYWIARTDLESALGGELPLAAPPPAAATPPPPPAEPHPHHRHHHHHGGQDHAVP